MSGFVLYSYYRSSSAYRVRAALNLKAIPYEYKAVHLVKDGGGQNTDDYLELNPAGEVPLLVHDGRPLAQSMAIMQYLDDVKPSPPLFPAKGYERAKVLEACELINSGVQPLQNLRVLRKLESSFSASKDDIAQWAAYWILRGFHAYERLVQHSYGKYSFGDSISAADLYLCPQVYNARRNKVDLSLFPIISEIEKNCLETEAFRTAYPAVQPDTPHDA